MRNQTQKRKQTQMRKQKPADSLLKTSKKKKDIELTEGQLGKVSGGYKVNVEYKEQK